MAGKRRSPGTRSDDFVYEAVLDFLDHQMLDRDGTPCGNVDDLELELPADGSNPRVVAILSGPMALGPRIGGTLGRWIGALGKTLHPHEFPEPARIEIRSVTKVGSAVELDTLASEMDTYRSEQWVLEHLIGRIPGADHASE